MNQPNSNGFYRQIASSERQLTHSLDAALAIRCCIWNKSLTAEQIRFFFNAVNGLKFADFKL